MQATQRSPEALFGALCFSIAVLATAVSYFFIFTSVDSGYIKGALALVVTTVSAGGLVAATRAFPLRVRPVPAIVSLAAAFGMFFLVWLITIGHGALDCWSCVKVHEHDFHMISGEWALWYLIVIAVPTALAAITISIVSTLLRRLLDSRRV